MWNCSFPGLGINIFGSSLKLIFRFLVQVGPVLPPSLVLIRQADTILIRGKTKIKKTISLDVKAFTKSLVYAKHIKLQEHFL